jgi:hypothetical protein
MPGDKGGPGEGMGNGFLRIKADKRGMDGLIVFIPELFPVSRRENVISIVVEEADQEKARARLVNLITWHGTREVYYS